MHLLWFWNILIYKAGFTSADLHGQFVKMEHNSKELMGLGTLSSYMLLLFFLHKRIFHKQYKREIALPQKDLYAKTVLCAELC